ncbi:MAG TPA: choice-of-anchor D domain-containing protein, partial [Bacteroidia bacterium]|nr:choice-of-anchor D domain-containing protein [Bacteroidia bacterium]
GQDDAVFNGTTGFAFSYDGTLLPAGTTWSFNSNGFMGLGTTVSAVPDFSSWARASAVNDVIMPFNTDLVLYSGAGYYEVSGIAPNRIMTFEWSSFGIYPNSSFLTGMQVKLYETTNTIEFWYRDLGYKFSGATLPASGSDPSAAIIGLNGNPISDHNYFSSGASSIPTSHVRFAFVPNTQLSVAPKIINYGAILAGQTLDHTVQIFHAGTQGTLNITSATITGNPDFTVVGALPSSLQPGQSSFITVRFTAQGNGSRSASLLIGSNGRDSGIQSVSLLGFTIAPNISIDSNVRFKKTRTRLGDSLTQWIHITAVGQAALFFSSFQIVGIDGAQYFVSHFPA